MSRDPSTNYYDFGGIEVLEIQRAKMTPEQFKGFMLGSVIKYVCRAQHKHAGDPEAEARDYEKAANYLTWLAEDCRRGKPPQFKDKSIDITRGVPSEEYVRRMRDG